MKSKGLTLIELVISLALAGIFMVMAINVLDYGFKVQTNYEEEYDLQAEMRLALEQVNRYIRFASAVFAVKADSFAPVATADPNVVTGLRSGWDFFGVSPDGRQLVRYRYESNVASANYDKHVIEPVVQNLGSGWDLSLNFAKANANTDDTLLAFQVIGTKNGVQVFEYSSELSALNALQVIDRGDIADRAIALAYRNDERPEVQNVNAAVAMVLDMSGSMNARMDGTGRDDSNPPSTARIRILRDKAKLLINTLRSAYVSVVPFSTTANIPHSSMPSGITSPSNFRSVDNVTDKSTLLSIVGGLTASGSTNTGDGIRRAYYQLKSFNNSPPTPLVGKTINNYVILLVDGATNSATMDMWRSGGVWQHSTSSSAVLTDGNLTRNLDLLTYGPFYNTNEPGGLGVFTTGRGIKGNPYAGSETTVGKDYVKLVGEQLIQAKGTGVQDLKIKCFVIGFSNVSTDLVSVGNVATSLGLTVTAADISNQFANHDNVYIATDSAGLQSAFESISALIAQDLWQVYGP